MKVYIGQLNTTVGALEANAELIRRTYADGVRAGADVVMVPELAVTGYPPRDLLDRPRFLEAALHVDAGRFVDAAATLREIGAPQLEAEALVLACREGDGAALGRSRELLHGLSATARLQELEAEVSSRSGES